MNRVNISVLFYDNFIIIIFYLATVIVLIRVECWVYVKALTQVDVVVFLSVVNPFHSRQLNKITTW